MRWSQTLIPTLRESPKEAEAVSHRLMLRGGYVRKLSAGVYSYLPLGFRVLQNVIKIIREEMNRANAEEVLLPALHPAELWKRTGRYEALGDDKISFKNRSGQEFVLGPTHEEIITELAAAYIQSYQDLPKTLYQIQTKFRDELRPRFGIIRTREFIMKDAYSFHRSQNDLEVTYQKIYEVYQAIMRRCGLSIKIVGADTGIMGGSVSHEFMVVCPYGEDHIVICDSCKTNVSRDIAERFVDTAKAATTTSEKPIELFDTPELRTIQELTGRFKISAKDMVKTILYEADGQVIAACVLGDSEINESKLRKVLGVSKLKLATGDQILEKTGAPIGFSGPVGLKNIKIVVDADILQASHFVTGANQKDKHFRNVSLGRDFKPDLVADLRFVREKDQCPKCKREYQVLTSMEVGHTFQLGTRYTKALDGYYRDEKGESQIVTMGCYGIGVNRLIAAAIEQHHDDKGIVWPISLAPFQISILTLNESDESTRKMAEWAYGELQKKSFSVLYDDRNERAGVKFNDADLIGIPIQVIVSERNLANHMLEVKIRKDRKSELIPVDLFIAHVEQLIKN